MNMLEEKVKAKIIELIALHPRCDELSSEAYELCVNDLSQSLINACRNAGAKDGTIIKALDFLKLHDDLRGVEAHCPPVISMGARLRDGVGS